jgi:hypothetical protein
LNFNDHESLDLGGRRIALTAPLDVRAAIAPRTTFASRRAIRNGQLEPVNGPAWDPTVVSSVATYSAASPLKLKSVANIAQIPVGSLVEGVGVGREVYVAAVDIPNQQLTLSQELFDAEGVQSFTFTRFKYLLDFSGLDNLSQFIIDDIEFLCEGQASGIMLAPDGLTFNLRDCFINRPRDRGITSYGKGCQGMLIDRCQFLSSEQDLNVADRHTIGFNANGNDVKIRDCRIVRFKHFCVLAGTGTLISGNHWFHGDNVTDGIRKGGIVITTPNCKSVITGNYIDNNFIEWTNEHDSSPALGVQYSFGGLTLTGNIFTVNDVAPWFTWIVIKPYGPGHYIHGFAVVSNVFRALNGAIDRVESVDTTFADLDYGRMKNVSFLHNTFNAVVNEAINPASIAFTQGSASATWTISAAPYMPFGGRARVVEQVVAEGRLISSAGATVYEMPYVETEIGTNKDEFRLRFGTACRGSVRVLARMDLPI